MEVLNTMPNIKDLDTEANRPILTLSITSQLSGIPAHSIQQYIERGLNIAVLTMLILYHVGRLLKRGEFVRMKTAGNVKFTLV